MSIVCSHIFSSLRWIPTPRRSISLAEGLQEGLIATPAICRFGEWSAQYKSREAMGKMTEPGSKSGLVLPVSDARVLDQSTKKSANKIKTTSNT